MSPIRGTFSPSGDSMKKCRILGIFRLSYAFYYEKAHVKTSWEDISLCHGLWRKKTINTSKNVV